MSTLHFIDTDPLSRRRREALAVVTCQADATPSYRGRCWDYLRQNLPRDRHDTTDTRPCDSEPPSAA